MDTYPASAERLVLVAGSSGGVRCHCRQRDQPRRGTRRESRRRRPSGDGPGEAGGFACAIAVSRRGDRRARARDRRRPSTRSGQSAGGERPRRRRARASAILASAPDPQAFKFGRDFSAWLGVTPKHNSTGGKEKFGSITKQGNRYIRRLLVLGAISILRAAPKRKSALCDWLVALRARKPAKVVAVALADKLARIVWAIITTGEAFRSSIYAKARSQSGATHSKGERRPKSLASGTTT